MKRLTRIIQIGVRLWSLMFVLAACLSIVTAQCQDAGLQMAVADQASKTISLFLFPRITNTDQGVATNAAKWTIVDISPAPMGPPPQITNVVLAADKLYPNNFLSASLDYTGNFDTTRKYILSNVDLTFNGCKPPNPSSTAVVFDLKKQSVTASTKSNGEADSDIYIAGQLEGSHKTRATQTADIKVEIPFSRHFLGRDRDIAPFFNLKASNSKKSDADSLKFGGLIRTTYGFRHFGLRNVSWESDGRIEADRRFGNVNVLWGNTLYLIPPLLGESKNLKVLTFLQPLVGFELGHNLKSPVKLGEDRTLARATAGGSLYLLFNTGNKYLDSISFQTDYIRRWPLRSEVSFTEDEKGNLLPLFFGRNPRDYVTSKIEFNVNDFFGIAVGYDYGRLPPNFKLVDSHYTLGFVYKKRIVRRIK